MRDDRLSSGQTQRIERQPKVGRGILEVKESPKRGLPKKQETRRFNWSGREGKGRPK